MANRMEQGWLFSVRDFTDHRGNRVKLCGDWFLHSPSSDKQVAGKSL